MITANITFVNGIDKKICLRDPERPKSPRFLGRFAYESSYCFSRFAGRGAVSPNVHIISEI
jgi:hypothetical protein